MPNAIELAKKYTPMLDEVYKQASLSSALDGAQDLVKEGYNANEIVIPMLDMDGLADYDRNSGYVDGDVTLTWQTVKCEFDRGRMFDVDELDNIETGGVVFANMAGNFIREKVVPELDAYRFAKYASKEGITKVEKNVTTGKAAIEEIRAAITTMDEDEVPYEGRILLTTSTFLGPIEDMDTTASRKALEKFSKIISVPQTRFYTAITQFDGKTEGQKKGGYAKAEGAKEINFMIIHPTALMQFNKLVKPKIVTPEQNQKSDSWKYGYRLVSLADVYQNKLAGVFCHTKE
ncbi:MAG: hypothetical protein J6L62_02750 [Clostridia bacterium]|nr:hypothetical protein [Clostridia bacterium]